MIGVAERRKTVQSNIRFDPYLTMRIIERACGEPLTDREVRFIRDCPGVRELFQEYIYGTLHRAMFLKGNFQSQYKMAQVMVAILTDATLDLTTGRDAVTLVPHPNRAMDAIEAGKIEVKSGGPDGSSHGWTVELTGKTGAIKQDVTVFVGYTETYNPCDAAIICLPKSVIEKEVQTMRERGNVQKEPSIKINRSRCNKQSGALNRWYEYAVDDLYDLRDTIGRYVHGVPLKIVNQLTMF